MDNKEGVLATIASYNSFFIMLIFLLVVISDYRKEYMK